MTIMMVMTMIKMLTVTKIGNSEKAKKSRTRKTSNLLLQFPKLLLLASQECCSWVEVVQAWGVLLQQELAEEKTSPSPEALVLFTSPTRVGTMATGSTISPKSSSKPDILG